MASPGIWGGECAIKELVIPGRWGKRLWTEETEHTMVLGQEHSRPELHKQGGMCMGELDSGQVSGWDFIQNVTGDTGEF